MPLCHYVITSPKHVGYHVYYIIYIYIYIKNTMSTYVYIFFFFYRLKKKNRWQVSIVVIVVVVLVSLPPKKYCLFFEWRGGKQRSRVLLVRQRVHCKHRAVIYFRLFGLRKGKEKFELLSARIMCERYWRQWRV